MFSTSECDWSKISMKILGATITGLKGFSFKRGIEVEHLYAAGNQPIDIQEGNIKPEGSIKILKHEFDKLEDAAQAAGYEGLIFVPHTLITITCAFKKRPTDPIRIIDAYGVRFYEDDVAAEQNAKFIDVNLPFLAMQVKARKGA